MPALKKNARKKKTVVSPERATFDGTRDKIAALIADIGDLYMQSKDSKAKIALWGLAYAHEDLVKLYHRIGNLQYTTKGMK